MSIPVLMNFLSLVHLVRSVPQDLFSSLQHQYLLTNLPVTE